MNTNNGMTKTEGDLKELIRQWEKDPCWDIEETEGFEEYKESLKTYRLAKETEWKTEREIIVLERCEKYGCNEEMLKLIESLQTRIKVLEEKK